MKKLLLTGIVAFFASVSINAQTNIATARSQSSLITSSSAPTVSTKGIVLNGSEFGATRYIQDATGGLAVFNASATTGINRGDTITVTGPLVGRYGVLQIAFNNTLAPGVSVIVTKTSSNNPMPAPTVLTNSQFFATANAEPTESKLIRVNGGTFAAAGGSFSYGTSGMSYTVNYSSGSFVVARITSSLNPLVGTTIPSGLVDIIGITGQFCGSTAGDFTCTTGYQLLPRDQNDIIASSVGINEAIKDVTSLSVYPNPTSGLINFNLSANEVVKSIIVTDISGRIVYSQNENTTSVNLNTLANGIYNLSVSTIKQNYRAKVTVIK